MGLFRRRLRRSRPLPEAARDVLGLAPRDRVLAWSALVGGGWVAATPAALRAVLPRGSLVNRPWTDVDHVAWEADSRMLAVWWVGSRTPTPLEVDEASFLPEVVHERVRSSLVLSQDVEVPGGTVRVTLRKADDGTLSTQAVPGRGVRIMDPAVEKTVERVRAQLRDDAGLPPGV